MLKFLFIFLSALSFGYAQDSTTVAAKKIKLDTTTEITILDWDTSKIEVFKNDKDFNYEETLIEENWWQQFKNWLWNGFSSIIRAIFGDSRAYSILANFAKILPYLIVGGIIGFIIWLFYKLNIGAKLFSSKKQPEVFYTDEEEIIKTKNIQLLIDKALSEKDYRLAVRYYYLHVLKILTDAQIISYAFDKTNSDYTNEITSEKIGNAFKKVTNAYNYIWYGSFAVSETDFAKAQQLFITIENEIPKNHV